MKQVNKGWLRTAAAMVVLMAMAGGAAAGKPEWAGQGGGGKRGGSQGGSQAQPRTGGYFGDRQRSEVQSYYRTQSRGGHCPPGLAKKNNGCMPPGQARKWSMGQPLPRDVQTYPLEPQVRVRLGVPPAGHEFVRVAGDILLIAAGTGMVVDAIQDLGR